MLYFIFYDFATGYSSASSARRVERVPARHGFSFAICYIVSSVVSENIAFLSRLVMVLGWVYFGKGGGMVVGEGTAIPVTSTSSQTSSA